jgi:serine/threonine protein kinase
MNHPPGREGAELPSTLVRRAERECDRFEAAWKAGQRPDLEDHLGAVPEAERSALLRELLLLEVDYRRLAGEQPRAEEFLARFPDLDRVWLAGVLSTVLTRAATVPDGDSAGATGDALIGRRIGPYLIEQRIGSGGMGSVYRAQREDAYRQRVALKVIRPGLGGREALRRFQTERQVLAELEHPHIARLLDGGCTDDGRPWFVMEDIDGEPLHRYCEGRQLGTRERVELLRRVCAAVQHAHARGVLHRDLKPDNVLVTAEGTPRVTDFGLAKRLDSESEQTASGMPLGTPAYMAPEQAAGKRAAVGAATDVYGLGAILYELLTGRPPFRGETPWDMLRQVQTEEPVPPSQLHPKLARDLETICQKCLRKDPARRYSTVADLADDLGRFLRGEPIRARPVSLAERLWRWCRRNPAVAAVAALLLTATVVLAIGLAVVNNARQETWKALERSRQAEKSAGEQRQVALETVRDVVGDLHARLKDRPGL